MEQATLNSDITNQNSTTQSTRLWYPQRNVHLSQTETYKCIYRDKQGITNVGTAWERGFNSLIPRLNTNRVCNVHMKWSSSPSSILVLYLEYDVMAYGLMCWINFRLGSS